jgi:hypothetical protein
VTDDSPVRRFLAEHRGIETVEVVSKLENSGIEWAGHGRIDIIPLKGRAIHFHSPAGLKIEAIQRP